VKEKKKGFRRKTNHWKCVLMGDLKDDKKKNEPEKKKGSVGEVTLTEV